VSSDCATGDLTPAVTAEITQVIMSRLATVGVVTDAQANGFILSLPASERMLKRALADMGWAGDLTILADEDGGNWTYFAFDANKLSPAQARQTALRIAADIRKGRT
jgi:hypothetical protein